MTTFTLLYTYSKTINRCRRIITITIALALVHTGTFAQCDGFSANLTLQHNTCPTGTNGRITVNVSGGSSPHQYQLNGGTWQNSKQFSGLTTGMYTVVARDVNGCIVTLTPAIEGPANFNVSPVVVNPSCGGTGSVSLSTSGGTAPYQYSINGSAFSSTTTYNNLSTGTYNGTVRDANSCTATFSFTVFMNTLSASVSSQTNVPCNGTSTGSFTISPVGGEPPYLYNLNGGTYSSSNTFSGLASGSYNGNIKDANNCTASFNVSLIQPAALIVGLESVTDASCNSTMGSITAAANGGTAPYQFSINNGTYGISSEFTDLAPGSYTIRVKDAANCVQSIVEDISEPGSVTATAIVSTGCGPASGSVIIEATDGVAPYLYKIDNTNYQLQNFFNGLNDDNYTVTIKDAENCTSTLTFQVENQITCSTTWGGGISSNWNDPSNWFDGFVPGYLTTAVIPVGSTPPVITNGSITVKAITLESGASVVLEYGTELRVTENITGNGNFTGEGVVTLAGSSLQNLTGNLGFNKLNLNNDSGAKLASGTVAEIYTVLQLESGEFETTGGTLKLKSASSDQIAIIDNFSFGYNGTIQGSIAAERAYQNIDNTNIYHFFSAPVNQPSFTQFAQVSGKNGIAITPTPDCDETKAASNSNKGNILEYDESKVATCMQQGWVVRSAGNAEIMKGYSVAKKGSGTLTVTGNPNQDNIYTKSGLGNSNWSTISKQGTIYNSGWHLLGNPYPAYVDLNHDLNSDFDNFVHVLQTEGMFAGTYQPVAMNSNAVIPPFGTFMTKKITTTGTSAFTISGSDRRTSATNNNKTTLAGVRLYIQGVGYADKTDIRFSPEATNGYDEGFDAEKLFVPSKPVFYTTSGDHILSINNLPLINMQTIVPVHLKTNYTIDYTLSAEQSDIFTNYNVVLIDQQTGISYLFEPGTPYNFTTIPGDDTHRFNLVFYSKNIGGTSIGKEILINPSILSAANVSNINVNAQNMQNAQIGGSTAKFNSIKQNQTVLEESILIFASEKSLFINLTSLAPEPVEVKLYDFTGRELDRINSIGGDNLQYDLSRFSTQHFLVSVQTGNAMVVKKISSLGTR